MTADPMKIRIGYVGVHIATYYAEEYEQFSRAKAGLAGLSQELGFEVLAGSEPVMDAAGAAIAESGLQSFRLAPRGS